MSTSYMDQTVGQFLEAIASREAAPGGGAVAATSVAMAAGLVAMAARFSEGQLDGATEIVSHADGLRERAAPLAQRDADAYAEVSQAYGLPREPDPEGRRERIREALRGATDVPLEIAVTAAEVAESAARLAREGNRHLTGDAVTAVLLADASARAAAGLVRVNVDAGKLGDEPVERAQRCVRTTASCVRDAGARADETS